MISLTCQAQQGLKRSHRRIPAVKAENKFIEVMLQVFGINAVVGTIEPNFEVPEGAMNRKCWSRHFQSMPLIYTCREASASSGMCVVQPDVNVRIRIILLNTVSSECVSGTYRKRRIFPFKTCSRNDFTECQHIEENRLGRNTAQPCRQDIGNEFHHWQRQTPCAMSSDRPASYEAGGKCQTQKVAQKKPKRKAVR